MIRNSIDESQLAIGSWFERFTGFMLLFAVAISAIIALPRFAPGIPLSVDTTSHLYRVLFLSKWLSRGVYPFWSSDWYGGSPTLLLYPPLCYFFSVAISMLGIDPLLSYKIVDAAFYCAAPLTLYLLAKEFGFSRGESAFAAVLYSVVPEVIENYLFYDRFPTVIAIPIFCAFVVMFHRTIVGSRRWADFFMSILLMSALLLTHHLSALIAGIVSVLVIVVERRKCNLARTLPVLTVLGAGTLCVTAFWFMPFLISLRLFSGNNFYNRNVIFPFITLSYFGVNVAVYLLGIIQFALALFAMSILSRKIYGNGIRLPFFMFFISLLGGMATYETGVSLVNPLLAYLGQCIVILSFVCFLGQFLLVNPSSKTSGDNRILIIVFWFVIFMWIGLGYYSLPLLWLPYIREVWIRTMDVYRIWLYLALPMSALASMGFGKLLLKTPSKLVSLSLIFLLATPMAVGVLLKVNYAFTAPVNGVLPYTVGNAEIPKPILDYFTHDVSSGRILGINVPFWIYVIPIYANKPILDGWYPQTKLVVPLVNVNDYRIDDLETTPSMAARLAIWGHLIADADALDITWIIIGGRKLADQLMIGGRFTEQLAVRYATSQGSIDLVVYKINRVPSFVDIDSSTAEVVNVTQPNPDKIDLTFKATVSPSEALVKEAYFPTWQAVADGHKILISRENSTGYILLAIPTGVTEITLYQNSDEDIWNVVSIIAIVVCCLGLASSLARRRSM